MGPEFVSNSVGALSIAASSMRADMEQVRAVANNLANTTTPGFRREVVSAQPFAATLDAMGAQASTGVVNSFDSTGGALKLTKRGLDVAVNGKGYLEVMTDTGSAYTRNGALRVDAQGRLVTDGGLPVMGDGGEIRANGEDVQIQPNGDVMQGEHVLGRLRVMRFDAASLRPLGNGLYAAQGQPQPADTEGGDVLRSGYLESSNVSLAGEMLRMTETVRHFEALQRVMQGYDDTLERTIRKLGEL
jgi:flagellar basal-body rod protein FlgG